MTGSLIMNISNFSSNGKTGNASYVRDKSSNFHKIMKEASCQAQIETDPAENITDSVRERESYPKDAAGFTENVHDTVEEVYPDEQLQAIEDSIKDVLLNKLNISEEELTASMEILGLNYLDFLNPKVLVDFISQNYQISDSLELVTNQEIYQNLKSIMEAMKEIAADNNVNLNLLEPVQTEIITAEDSNYAVNQEGLRQWNQEPDTQTDSQTFKSISAEDSSGKAADPISNQTNLTTETDAVNSLGSNGEGDTNDNLYNSREDSDIQQYDPKLHKGLVLEEIHESAEEKSDSGKITLPNNREAKADNLTAIQNLQAGTSEKTYEIPVENVNFELPDTNYIANQLIEKIKISVTPDVKQLEMQLQPESLGKIHLQLVAKDGMITAHIVTQNEVVKEAVESQLNQLKEQFAQQNIQVKAVDVSVGSQGFEENLWQGGQEDQNSQNNSTKNRRHIQLNLLDDQEIDFSEDELLEAEIMKQNGTSISFTA